MKAFRHPDEQTAFNVLLQLGVPQREARALAARHTTPNVVAFLALAFARLAATLPPERNPLDELRRALRAAAPTRTIESPFFFPTTWPAVFVGGPGDGAPTSVGFLDARRVFSDRDGELHVYRAEWWWVMRREFATPQRLLTPRRSVIELRYAGKLPRPKWRRIDVDEDDDGEAWKRDDGPRGSGH